MPNAELDSMLQNIGSKLRPIAQAGDYMANNSPMEAIRQLMEKLGISGGSGAPSAPTTVPVPPTGRDIQLPTERRTRRRSIPGGPPNPPMNVGGD